MRSFILALVLALTSCGGSDAPPLAPFPAPSPSVEAAGAEAVGEDEDEDERNRIARREVDNDLASVRQRCRGSMAALDARITVAERRLVLGHLAALGAVIAGETLSQTPSEHASPDPTLGQRSPLTREVRMARTDRSQWAIDVNQAIDELAVFLREHPEPGEWSPERWREWHAALEHVEGRCRATISV